MMEGVRVAPKRKQPVKVTVSVVYAPTFDSRKRLKKVMALLLRHPAKVKEQEDANS